VTKFYLAARYSRYDEMCGVRDVLEGLGHEVTSRWVDRHNGTLPQSIPPNRLNGDPGSCAPFALNDLSDMVVADAVVSFTSRDGGGKGGRHVEFGWALAAGKRVIVVGPREHVFHTLPQVEWYPDWPHFVMALSKPWDAKAMA
jgi:hypothetical protein